MALKSENIEIFQKNITLARAPTLSKKPMEPSLMTFRFSVVEIDTTIESSPLWFLIGFRLQRLGKGNGIQKFNSVETGNLTFEW